MFTVMIARPASGLTQRLLTHSDSSTLFVTVEETVPELQNRLLRLCKTDSVKFCELVDPTVDNVRKVLSEVVYMPGVTKVIFDGLHGSVILEAYEDLASCPIAVTVGTQEIPKCIMEDLVKLPNVTFQLLEKVVHG